MSSRFVLCLQRNWTGQQKPTGDKMVAFVYNKLPETRKQLFDVNFVTAENIHQMQRMLPELKGTPSLFDMQTNTNVMPGDATLFAMLQLAHSWSIPVRLAELHPDCIVYDQKFDAAIRATLYQQQQYTPAASMETRMQQTQKPRTREEMIAYIISLPLPREREQQAEFLRQVKNELGFIPVEIIAKINESSQTGKMINGTTVAKDMNSFSQVNPKVAEELKKLAGAPLGDAHLDMIIGTTKLDSPFVDYTEDDYYEMAAYISSGDSVLNDVNYSNPMDDPLSKIDPKMIPVTAPGEAPTTSMMPRGLPRETQEYLDRMRAQLEAKHGSTSQAPMSNVRSAVPQSATQSGMGQSGMGYSGMPQSGMGYSGMGQSGMGQSGMPQSGMGQSGMPHSGMGQSGMGYSGMGQSATTQSAAMSGAGVPVQPSPMSQRNSYNYAHQIVASGLFYGFG